MSQGRVTISRYTSNRNEGGVFIEVIDNDSRVHFCRITLTLEAFARVVTGQGEVEGELEVRGLNLVGKIAEHKTVVVDTPRPYGNKTLLVRAKMAMQKHEIDGWMGRSSDLENPYNYTDGGIDVVFTRHVDIK